ncbi:MAG: hydroxymethylbilane synthase, partial [Candidatus Hydrogenedentota bacterium]
MKRRLVIGTRGSDLAMAQTNGIAARIREIAPEAEVVVEIIHSQGDKVQHVPLAQMGGKGLF